jgi:N-acyl-D-aspartate/D-glutamate deacylase
MLDLVIRNGLVVDGTGSPSFHADVGVAQGRIVEVGRVTTPAARTIDAAGCIVTPGFVDIHTHYDGQASWDGVLAPSSLNGVTSVVMGNCGVGFAPVRPDAHATLISLLEGVEDIPGTALAEGLTWDWESFPDYLDALDRRKFAVDLGAYVPHAALRAYVMGARGGDAMEKPTEDEITAMEEQVYAGVKAGAVGFSTSRTRNHKTKEGALIGTLYSDANELMLAARALRRAGRGICQVVSDAFLDPEESFATAEMKLIEQLATQSGRPLTFSLAQMGSVPQRWRYLLARTNEMVDSGLKIRAQVAARAIGAVASFSTTINPYYMLPSYKALPETDVAERLRLLALPETRARVLGEHRSLPQGTPFHDLHYGYDRMFRMEDPVDYEPDASMSIGAEARRLGRDPTEHAYDVFLEQDGYRMIYLPIINYGDGNLSTAYELLTAPHTLYGLSDGGAHCGSICDASFPTTMLSLWLRGNKQGQRIPVEQVVHGYTQRNAEFVGWLDRGVIAPGYLADLNVIDLDSVSLSPPKMIQDLPAGGTRLLQRPVGFRYTIKNGNVTFESGEWTGILPGGLLRGERALAA